MNAVALLSVEEYLANPGVPESEYVDGVLRSRSMPTTLHGIIQFLLVAMLRSQGVRALAEVSIRPTPSKFLIPDVIAGREIGLPYPTPPVDLCVEILSPDGRAKSVLEKCVEYHEWSAPYCWVIDPVRHVAWEAHANAEPVLIPRSGSLRAGALNISLEQLFSAAEAEIQA